MLKAKTMQVLSFSPFFEWLGAYCGLPKSKLPKASLASGFAPGTGASEKKCAYKTGKIHAPESCITQPTRGACHEKCARLQVYKGVGANFYKIVASSAHKMQVYAEGAIHTVLS